MFPEKLEIAGSQDTPGVLFDKDLKIFKLNGRSFPADADEFFQPLLKWLNDFKESGTKDVLNFEVSLEYFNTASAKLLLDIFFKLEDIKETGVETKILWTYLEDDEDMQEAGEEFNDIVELDFEFNEIE